MDKLKNFWLAWQAKRELKAAENLKLKELQEKSDQIIALLTPQKTELIIKDQLENFDFSPLWEDEPQSDWLKFLPIISLIFDFIILIMLIWRN